MWLFTNFRLFKHEQFRCELFFKQRNYLFPQNGFDFNKILNKGFKWAVVVPQTSH